MPPHAAGEHGLGLRCLRDDSVDARLQKQLFDNIARAAYKRLDRFSDQGLSNIAWAFAAAGEAQRHEKLFGAVASEAAPRVAEFQPQGFSNLAWCVARCLSFAWTTSALMAWRFSFPRRAFSTAELSSSELFTAMASEIAKQNRAARFNPRKSRDSVLRYKIAFIHTHGVIEHCVGLREERRGLEAVVRQLGRR